MNMMSSIILFAVFIMVYGILIEVFTVLFQLTGITREKARTQVISLLTNCGFTTSESEVIMSSKRRRSLARMTMLWGYSFSVIIVSILVNMFLTLNQTEARHLLGSVLFAGIFVAAYVMVMRLKKVRQKIDLLIERIGTRFMFGRKANVLILIDILRDRAMVEVVLDNVPACLANRKLSQSNLKEEYNIQILYIKRKDEPVDVVDGNTMIEQGDSLLLFGDYKSIRGVFERVDA